MLLRSRSRFGSRSLARFPPFTPFLLLSPSLPHFHVSRFCIWIHLEFLQIKDYGGEVCQMNVQRGSQSSHIFCQLFIQIPFTIYYCDFIKRLVAMIRVARDEINLYCKIILKVKHEKKKRRRKKETEKSGISWYRWFVSEWQPV